MKKNTVIVLLILLFISCTKKQQNETDFTEVQEQNTIVSEVDSNPVTEKTKPIYIYYDDSVNDEAGIVEYNLQNGNQNFCLYHVVTKIDGFDYEDCTLVGEWRVGQEIYGWVKQEREDFSVAWTYPEAIIVRLSTTSPEWKTKRGIHVGSTRKEVEAAYEKDADVYEFKNEKAELIQDLENELFVINKGKAGFSINTPNYKDEEMMSMILYLTDDIVSKIEIKIGC